MTSVLVLSAAVLAGSLVGWCFGLLQAIAVAHNGRLQKEGRLRSAWSVMPGSAGRVALLLVSLVLIQVVCPLLFDGGVEWYVSAGVLAGYGLQLYAGLRRKVREARA